MRGLAFIFRWVIDGIEICGNDDCEIMVMMFAILFLVACDVGCSVFIFCKGRCFRVVKSFIPC